MDFLIILYDKIKISRVQIKCLIARAPDCHRRRRQIGTHTECDSHAYFVSHHSLAHVRRLEIGNVRLESLILRLIINFLSVFLNNLKGVIKRSRKSSQKI